MRTNIIDLTGKRFGRLVVLEIGYRGKQGLFWKCLCDCGIEKAINGHSLRRGTTKSCGCKKLERMSDLGKTKRKDLAGKNFGRLLVKDFALVKNNAAYWHCICDCGNNIVVSGLHLRDGHTQSCGCLQKERSSETFFKNITDNKYGSLLVISLYGTIKKRVFWNCLCDCGKKTIVSGGNLCSGTVKSCGCRKRTLVKNYELSEKTFTDRELLRKSVEYKEWRNFVFEKDKYSCEKCEKVGGYLEAHHIFSFDKNLEARFDIENGITFCKQCHTDFHKTYGFGDNTENQLIEFLNHALI